MPRTRTQSPIPLPDLLRINRSAATVYAALRWQADDKRQMRTTRPRIIEVCGWVEQGRCDGGREYDLSEVPF